MLNGAYSVKEIADKLKVHPNTIYKYIKSGELNCIQMGTHYRIFEEDVIEFRKRLITGQGEKGQMEDGRFLRW